MISKNFIKRFEDSPTIPQNGRKIVFSPINNWKIEDLNFFIW